MKRLLVLLCALLALSGCSAWGGKENTSPSSLVDRPIAVIEGASPGQLNLREPWGIKLSVEDVTPTGLTLVCTQSGGENVTELTTGGAFLLEQLHGDHWHACEPVIENYAFTAEGWIIPLDERTQWEVDWEWLYGELAPGTYRISKDILNVRGAGDYDKIAYYAKFEIE